MASTISPSSPPSEFRNPNDSVGHWSETLAKNGTVWGAMVIALLLVGGGVTFLASKRGEKANDGLNALYLAQKTLQTELKTLAPPKPAANAKDPVAAKKSAADPTAGVDAFQILDVDTKLPGATRQFSEVSQKYAGTRAAFEAEMSLGKLYFDHGDAAKARGWLEKANAHAPSHFERALSYSALGSAAENLGQFPEAAQFYQKGLDQGEASLKGELMLAIARSYEGSKDVAKARSTYDQIIAQLPNTDFAHAAEARQSLLP